MSRREFVQHFESNTAGRDLVVGDIHGCLGRLRRVLQVCEFDPDRDRLFSVGDLVDRGPESVGVLALLSEPWFHATMGNHEWLLALYAGGELEAEDYASHGGRWAESLPKSQLDRLALQVLKLPFAIIVGAGTARFNVLHAEFFGSNQLLDDGQFNEALIGQILWGRDIMRGRVAPNALASLELSKTYVGHTIRPQVQAVGPFVFIDTGSYRSEGCITIIEPATGNTWTSRLPAAEYA